MIRNFGGGAAEDIFNGDNTKEARKVPQTVWRIARRKLEHIDSAESLQDLSAIPGNRLEKLKGELSEYRSIRINDQFRIVFRWEGGNAFEVRIEDYH